MRILRLAPPTPSGPAIALLAPAFASPEDFEREGFGEALATRGIGAGLTVAEAPAAAFADGSLVKLVDERLVTPLRAATARVWLGGISLGALGAIAYAARHADAIAGLLLLAPYPASRVAVASLRDRARGTEPGAGDLEAEAWRWLLARSPGDAPPVLCRLASGDRFLARQRELAATLDPACVRELPGGHDWPTWRRLWDDLLLEFKGTGHLTRRIQGDGSSSDPSP